MPLRALWSSHAARYTPAQLAAWQTAKKKIIELESGAQNAPKLNRRSSSSKMSKRDSKRVLPGDEEPAPLWKEPLKDAAAVDPPPPKSAGCVLL